jgi:acetylornithine deacetylase/succinyl-diaminopimelate desuccinylase-like protein
MQDSAPLTADGLMPELLADLERLVAIPSVSVPGRIDKEQLEAHDLVARLFADVGIDVDRIDLPDTAPIVVGGREAPPGAPTVLLYSHYDVVPSGDEALWDSPPFEPTERDGNLYARGAVDDKGQMYMHVKALESLLATTGKLPLNVRVLLEGEEEVGGEGIASFVASKPPELKSDFALVSDTELFAPGLPTLCVGLRGMIYTELEVRGAKTDLHSGMYGGAAPNPFVSLAQILAKLKDESGRILIPGFYDDIIPPSPEELAAWKSLPFDEEEYRVKEVGAKALVGEQGYSVLERTWARPALDVHGIPGGFTGAGAKTVIPAKATAKVSMRLVPGMTPAKSFELYKTYVEKIAPAGVDVSVRLIHSGDPCLIPVNNQFIQAATRALHEVWGKDTVFIRSGGSIPIVGDFDRHLGLPSVMMGFGLPDDNLHAPNEKFHLKNFELGIKSIIRFLEETGR